MRRNQGFALMNSGYSVQKALCCTMWPSVGVISKEAKKRLKWMDYYHAHQHNASLTCRYFGISRKTFHKWFNRFKDKKDPRCLESRSKRPKTIRHSKKIM